MVYQGVVDCRLGSFLATRMKQHMFSNVGFRVTSDASHTWPGIAHTDTVLASSFTAGAR
jgi:hypothetical protein